MKKRLTKKRAFAKNTWYDWYDWLINYINLTYNPKSIKKTVDGVKDQIMSIFKNKDSSKTRRVKTMYGGGKKLN